MFEHRPSAVWKPLTSVREHLALEHTDPGELWYIFNHETLKAAEDSIGEPHCLGVALSRGRH